MPQDPFPAQGRDGQEPDGSRPLPADRTGPGSGAQRPEDGRPGPEQGLFVCLPAGQVTLAGFGQDGVADTMAPGALLSAVVDAVTGQDGAGLAGLSDDQLVGIVSAARRMESRAAWTLLAALRELARRRPAGPQPGDAGRAGCSEFAADEVAGELHLSWQSAAGQIGYACAVADRLPRTFAALAAGRVHPVHVRIIEDETSVLSPAEAAAADEELAAAAGSMTFSRLRSAARRLVLTLDPDAARRRKQAASRDAHVRRFREDSGNAGMIARELPPDEVLASWQHVEQRALDLRAAGLPGTLTELRVRAYLDLLQERDSRTTPGDPDPDQAAGPPGPHSRSEPGGPQHGSPGSGPADSREDGTGSGGAGSPQDTRTGHGRNPGAGPQDGDNGPRTGGTGGGGPGKGGTGAPGDGPAGAGGNDGNNANGADGSVRPARPGAGPGLAALVNITVPLSTVLGQSATPGEAAGFGLLDAPDARDLVAAAARHPDTRWCLTVLHPDGTAAAHGCARGRHPPPPGPPGHPAGPPGGGAPGPDPPPGSRPLNWLPRLRTGLVPVARGPCDHARAETGYRPSRPLAHRVKVRNARCTAPGCGRPAARCDLDHTQPWDQGGITCECDLAPLCKR